MTAYKETVQVRIPILHEKNKKIPAKKISRNLFKIKTDIHSLKFPRL